MSDLTTLAMDAHGGLDRRLRLKTASARLLRQGLLKPHDYDVDISGGTPAAHYVSELREFAGITVPTKHTTLGRQPGGAPMPTPLVVSIDISEVEFGR